MPRRSPLGWFVLVLIAAAPALSGCRVGGQSGPTTGKEGQAPAPALNPTQSAPLDAIPESTDPPAESETASSLERGSAYGIGSPAFAAGEPIPAQFSCDGENISPPLEWGDPPPGTASFALIADDPDAPGGTWVHWVLFNLPPDQRSLPDGIPTEAAPAGGGLQGANSAGRLGYTGPCPPSGIHRYFFKLYALDTELPLTAGASKAELLGTMEGHVLGQAEIIGTYAR